jgi:hypothetical protein
MSASKTRRAGPASSVHECRQINFQQMSPAIQRLLATGNDKGDGAPPPQVGLAKWAGPKAALTKLYRRNTTS